jgi:predicted RNA polymerase sigma factor
MAWARDSRDPSGHDHALTAARDALAVVFREEAGRLAASVTRILGDFDAAEEVVQDALLCHLPSPVTRLHRAIALGQVLGPQAALSETDALAADLDRYHLYHATRAELLPELGRPVQAGRPTSVLLA